MVMVLMVSLEIKGNKQRVTTSPFAFARDESNTLSLLWVAKTKPSRATVLPFVASFVVVVVVVVVFVVGGMATRKGSGRRRRYVHRHKCRASTGGA